MQANTNATDDVASGAATAQSTAATGPLQQQPAEQVEAEPAQGAAALPTAEPAPAGEAAPVDGGSGALALRTNAAASHPLMPSPAAGQPVAPAPAAPRPVPVSPTLPVGAAGGSTGAAPASPAPAAPAPNDEAVDVAPPAVTTNATAGAGQQPPPADPRTPPLSPRHQPPRSPTTPTLPQSPAVSGTDAIRALITSGRSPMPSVLSKEDTVKMAADVSAKENAAQIDAACTRLADEYSQYLEVLPVLGAGIVLALRLADVSQSLLPHTGSFRPQACNRIAKCIAQALDGDLESATRAVDSLAGTTGRTAAYTTILTLLDVKHHDAYVMDRDPDPLDDSADLYPLLKPRLPKKPMPPAACRMLADALEDIFAFLSSLRKVHNGEPYSLLRTVSSPLGDGTSEPFILARMTLELLKMEDDPYKTEHLILILSNVKAPSWAGVLAERIGKVSRLVTQRRPQQQQQQKPQQQKQQEEHPVAAVAEVAAAGPPPSPSQPSIRSEDQCPRSGQPGIKAHRKHKEAECNFCPACKTPCRKDRCHKASCRLHVALPKN